MAHGPCNPSTGITQPLIFPRCSRNITALYKIGSCALQVIGLQSHDQNRQLAKVMLDVLPHVHTYQTGPH